MVQAQIAGVNDVAVRSFYYYAHSIRDRMRNGKKVYAHITDFYRFIFLYNPQVNRRQVRKLLLTLLYHKRGEIARVNRRIADFSDEIGDGAYMVKMSVRYKNSFYLVAAFLQIFTVREYVINPRCVFFFERKTGINDNNVFSDFNKGHIAANFLDPAQMNDADVAFGYRGKFDDLFCFASITRAFTLAFYKQRSDAARRSASSSSCPACATRLTVSGLRMCCTACSMRAGLPHPAGVVTRASGATCPRKGVWA